jgi:hypothetical protein
MVLISSSEMLLEAAPAEITVAPIITMASTTARMPKYNEECFLILIFPFYAKCFDFVFDVLSFKYEIIVSANFYKNLNTF